MKHDIKRLLLASTLLMGLQSQAHAEETASTPAPADPASEDDIIVTGSRLTTNLEQAAPIVSVTQTDLALSGQVNIENVLKELPQLLPGATAASNDPGDATATANLRGLGTARTLVLVNGRRYISYDVNQIVDLNTIPTALIERVDVVTGGKSAVYGSDAVTGVVNFVTKQDFEGVQANANYRITGKGDGGTFNGGLLLGKNFDEGRGNITVYGDYLDRKAIQQSARSYTSEAQDGGSLSIPQGMIQTTPNSAPVVLNQDGSYRSYMGDSYNYAPENYMQVPQKRALVSAQAHYDVNDSLTLYAEGQYVHNRIRQQLAPTAVAGVFGIDVDSPYLASDTQALFSGGGYAPVYLYRRMSELGDRYSITTSNAYRGVLGGRGTISGDWDFDVYGSYSETRRVERQYNGVSASRLQQALLTADDGNGNLVCLDPSNGCVPINVFGEGNISQAAADFVRVNTVSRSKVSELVASGAVTNKHLFDLGAGSAGMAFGAEYRREHGSFTPDDELASGDVLGWPTSQATSGGYNVKELFAEIEVPLLADKPFVDRLTFNGAARLSDYSTATNTVGTFSAGLVYSPIRDFSLRGQLSRAVRAPTINELYYGATESSGSVSDPLFAGTLYENYTVIKTTAGNANLREETATTYTLGAVVQPQAVPGLLASVDYYHIKIDDFIATRGPSNILAACYGTEANGYTPYDTSYCSLITRDTSTGQITNIEDDVANSGGVKTDGIDFSVAYGFPLNFGKEDSRLDFQLGGTRLLSWKYQPIASISDLVLDCAGKFGTSCGNVYAKWRLNGRASWSTSKTTLSLAWRHLSPVHDDNDDLVYTTSSGDQSERISAYDYFDLSAAIRVADRFTWTLGMNNMFDRKPPIVGTNQDQANTYPSTYDVYGRTFFTSIVVSL